MDDRLRKEAGRAGEAAALAYLEQAGLQLVTRNFRCKRGEIDLVMLDGATLVLVEVRYRSSEQFGGAAASVTWRKQRRLANAARVPAARAPGAAALSGAFRRRRDLGGAQAERQDRLDQERVHTLEPCWKRPLKSAAPTAARRSRSLLDLSVEEQSYIEDCSVCCQPMTVSYSAEDGELAQRQRRGRRLMWRRLRIVILLLVLLFVALNTYFDRVYSTDWNIPLRVAAYPINCGRQR